MSKRKILLLYIFLFASEFCLFSESINILDVFKLDISNTLKTNNSSLSTEYEITNGYSVLIGVNNIINNIVIQFYLKPKKNIELFDLFRKYFIIPEYQSIQSLNNNLLPLITNPSDESFFKNLFDNYGNMKKNLNNDEINSTLKIYFSLNSKIKKMNYFGMGNIYEVIKNPKSDVIKMKLKNGIPITKYISIFGSMMTHDILVYNFSFNDHPFFDECLVEIINIYPKISDKDITTMYIENLIIHDNPKVEIYKLFDEMIQSIESLK
jgi:hypothetical protein